MCTCVYRRSIAVWECTTCTELRHPERESEGAFWWCHQWGRVLWAQPSGTRESLLLLCHSQCLKLISSCDIVFYFILCQMHCYFTVKFGWYLNISLECHCSWRRLQGENVSSHTKWEIRRSDSIENVEG